MPTTCRVALSRAVTIFILSVAVVAASAVALPLTVQASTARLTLSIGPSSQTQAPGGGFRLGGHLALNGHPLAGSTITVWRIVGATNRALVNARTDGSGAWSAAGSTTQSMHVFATATATPWSTSTRSWTVLVLVSALGPAAVNQVAREAGAPYVWGAAGPSAFDCSGLTQYVFGRFGRYLPHNAQAQYDQVRHIPAGQAQLGDLVFFGSPGGIYHVGIYAGGNYMWDDPHSGSSVGRRVIWSSSYLIGRVG